MYEDKKKIEKEISYVKQLLKDVKDNDTRFVLYKYLSNLYEILCSITGKKCYVPHRKIFGSLDDYDRYTNISNRLYDRFYKNFTYNKDFHNEYVEDVLDCRYDELSLESDYLFGYCKFNKKEFFDIFYEFCKSFKLDKYFDEIIKDDRIIEVKHDGFNHFLGYYAVNPVTNSNIILIRDLEYNLDNLVTLAHEFGHYCDYRELIDNIDYNELINYDYKSIYGEVISKLFERLFLDFMLKNNIKVNDVKDKYIYNELLNLNYLEILKIFSLLDDKYILKGNYECLDVEQLFNKVKDYFDDEDYIKDFIKFSEFNLCEDITYAYGDMISLFLKDEVDSCLFNGELFKKFMNNRTKEFNTDFIEENDLCSDKCNKIFRKEMKSIKK